MCIDSLAEIPKSIFWGTKKERKWSSERVLMIEGITWRIMQRNGQRIWKIIEGLCKIHLIPLEVGSTISSNQIFLHKNDWNMTLILAGYDPLKRPIKKKSGLLSGVLKLIRLKRSYKRFANPVINWLENLLLHVYLMLQCLDFLNIKLSLRHKVQQEEK